MAKEMSLVSGRMTLNVLRVTDLNKSLTFYRDKLGFEVDWEDPALHSLRLRSPDGQSIFLTTDPELDVQAMYAPQATESESFPTDDPVPVPEEVEDDAPILDGQGKTEDNEVERSEAEPVDPLAEEGQPTAESEAFSSKPEYEVREVSKEEGLQFPGEDLEVFQERLEAFGIYDLLLEETPGVEQVLKMRDPDDYLISLREELRMSDEEVLELYRKGPDLLEGAILGLEEEDLDWETAEGLTIRQMILQIVDFDLEMMQRVKWALAENGRSYKIPLFDPDEWGERLHYTQRTIHVEVNLFRMLREHLLNQLYVVADGMGHYLVSDQGEVEVRTMVQVAAETVREQIQIIMEARRHYGK